MNLWIKFLHKRRVLAEKTFLSQTVMIAINLYFLQSFEFFIQYLFNFFISYFGTSLYEKRETKMLWLSLILSNIKCDDRFFVDFLHLIVFVFDYYLVSYISIPLCIFDNESSIHLVIREITLVGPSNGIIMQNPFAVSLCIYKSAFKYVLWRVCNSADTVREVFFPFTLICKSWLLNLSAIAPSLALLSPSLIRSTSFILDKDSIAMR